MRVDGEFDLNTLRVDGEFFESGRKSCGFKNVGIRTDGALSLIVLLYFFLNFIFTDLAFT